MKKPIFVIFEGIDKTGKTTLYNTLNKISNYKYVAIDRFMISAKVYNEVYDRGFFDVYNAFEKVIRKSFNVLYVYCKSNETDVHERLENANENIPTELSDFEKIDALFEKYLFDESCGPCCILILDTSQLSLSECITELFKQLHKMEIENGSN